MDRLDRRLYIAGICFGIASALHIIDHLRRGQGSVTDTLNWAGTLALIVQVVVVTLIVTHNRFGPLAAASAGLPLAVGFFVAHWLPEWSPMSDPVWNITSVAWFSYLASSLEIISALAVGLCGMTVVRARGLATFAT